MELSINYVKLFLNIVNTLSPIVMVVMHLLSCLVIHGEWKPLLSLPLPNDVIYGLTLMSMFQHRQIFVWTNIFNAYNIMISVEGTVYQSFALGIRFYAMPN